MPPARVGHVSLLVGRVLPVLQLHTEIDTEQQCRRQQWQAPCQKGRISEDCKHSGLPPGSKTWMRGKRLTISYGESGKKFIGIRSKLSESSYKLNLKLSAFVGCIIFRAPGCARAVCRWFLQMNQYRDTDDERDSREREYH